MRRSVHFDAFRSKEFQTTSNCKVHSNHRIDTEIILIFAELKNSFFPTYTAEHEPINRRAYINDDE